MAHDRVDCTNGCGSGFYRWSNYSHSGQIDQVFQILSHRKMPCKCSGQIDRQGKMSMNHSHIATKFFRIGVVQRLRRSNSHSPANFGVLRREDGCNEVRSRIEMHAADDNWKMRAATEHRNCTRLRRRSTCKDCASWHTLKIIVKCDPCADR